MHAKTEYYKETTMTMANSE